MKKRKIITTLTLALVLVGAIGSIGVSAGFGSGIAVAADGTSIIKTGIYGQKIVFSDLDFKQGLAITDFDEIKIASIPKSSEGTLLLAGRRVAEGTVIKRKNLGALVFIPASKDVAECKFEFTTDDFAEGAKVDFIIKFTDKVNYAPEILEVKEASLDTQRDISVYGRMEATDAEGDDIEYLIVSYPKAGMLKKVDSTSGEYIYTPPANYTGTDSFAYVARDEWGNYSKLCKVKIEVSERMSEVVYSDMTDHPQYNAAVALTAMGIIDGTTIGDGKYFQPDSEVTREEFLAMAMKCAGIKPDTSTSPTYFDDNDEISTPLLPYVKAAQKQGIIVGEFTNGELVFRPGDAITKYEAALILSELTEISQTDTETSFADRQTLPVWARDAISALCSVGIFDFVDNNFDGGRVLSKAECVDCLYKMLKYCS